MNAPSLDPARAALATALAMTVKKRRFPRELDLKQRVKGQSAAVDLLLDDGRYLVRVDPIEAGAPPVRVATTIRGILEAESSLAQTELQGLARTHDRLCTAVRQGVFHSGRVGLESLRELVASDFDFHEFRRWCTLLCSPRLQGRYSDPTGYYGRTDAIGTPVRGGLLASVFVAPWFLEWPGLPERERRRAFLFPQHGLRVAVDAEGTVEVLWAGERIAVLGPSLGSAVYAALVSRPMRSIHSLDLQSHDADGMAIPDDPSMDLDQLGDDLFNLAEIELDVAKFSADEQQRLMAIVRRVDVLQRLVDSSAPPRWAKDPAKRRQEILDELRASLVDGPPKADNPIIKNATRAVVRALDTVLEHEALVRFADDFVGSERLKYVPRD